MTEELPSEFRTKNHEYHREGDSFYKDGREIDRREYRIAKYNARPNVRIPGPEGESYRNVEVDFMTASEAGRLANNPESNETVTIDGREYTAQEIADAFKKGDGLPITYE